MHSHHPVLREEISHYYAKQAIAYVRKVLPLGSSNKKVDESKPTYQLAYKNILKAQKEVDNAGLTSIPLGESIAKRARIYETYQVGWCVEQTIVAYQFLKSQGVTDLEIVFLKGGDHVFLLIGGNVICDPWENREYHVNEFKAFQAESKADYSDDSIKYKQYLGEPIRPFLYGTPHSELYASTGPSVIDGKFVRVESSPAKASTLSETASAFRLARESFVKLLREKKEDEAMFFNGDTPEYVTYGMPQSPVYAIKSYIDEFESLNLLRTLERSIKLCRIGTQKVEALNASEMKEVMTSLHTKMLQLDMKEENIRFHNAISLSNTIQTAIEGEIKNYSNFYDAKTGIKLISPINSTLITENILSALTDWRMDRSESQAIQMALLVSFYPWVDGPLYTHEFNCAVDRLHRAVLKSLNVQIPLTEKEFNSAAWGKTIDLRNARLEEESKAISRGMRSP